MLDGFNSSAATERHVGLSPFVLTILLVNLMSTIGHAITHTHLGIETSQAQLLLVIGVLLAAPLAAMGFLLNEQRRAGGGVLLASMACALVFGLFITGGTKVLIA